MHHRIGRLLLCAALLLPACGGGRVTYASQDAPDAVPDVHVVDAAADRAGDQPEPDISADAPSDVAQDGLPDASDQADAAIPSDAAGEHEADLPAPPDAPDAAKDAAEVPDSPGETEVFVPALQTEKIRRDSRTHGRR